MDVDKSQIGLTFKHPAVSRETQEAALRAAGASWVVHVGKLVKNWQPPMQQLREGDVMYVYACTMITAPRDELGPQGAQWTAFVKGIHEKGATLVEVSTGRRSKVPAQWREMNRETHAAFRKSGKALPRGIMPKGRPRRSWPNPKVEADAMKLWKSKHLASDAAAIRAIMEQFSDLLDDKKNPLVSERLIRTLGKSGRNT